MPYSGIVHVILGWRYGSGAIVAVWQRAQSDLPTAEEQS
jgi:hypothetical protein